MKFKKILLRKYHNSEFNLTFEYCHRYQIFDGDSEVANFYFKNSYSFGTSGDMNVAIFPSPNSLIRFSYLVKNVNNDAVIGNIKLSLKGMNPLSLATIEIIHRSIYNWEIHFWDYYSGLIPPQTKSKFWATLENEKDKSEIHWDYKGDEVWYQINECPIESEIRLSNQENLYELFVMPYLAELRMEFSTTEGWRLLEPVPGS